MADFITRDEYKAYKGKASTGNDDKIDVLIPIVTSYIKEYCKRTFVDYYGSPRRTEYFNSNNTTIYVSEFPIVGSPAIEVYYSTDNGVSYTQLVENTDFFVDYEEGSITTGDGSYFYVTYKPFKSLKVVYNGGTASAPDDIKLASYLLIDYLIDKQYIENRSVNANVMQTFDSNKLPFHIRNLLERHRELI